MAEFLMPALGADMEAGTLVSFRKRPGDRVARGEIFAEVETDKGIIEIECFHEGQVERLLIAPGTRVAVGTVLAVIKEDGGIPAPQPRTSAPAVQPEASPAQETVPTPESARTTSVPSLRATPAARRLLRRRGLDASQVRPVDPLGRLTPPALDVAPSAQPVAPRVELSPGVHRTQASPRARALAQARGVDLAGLHGSGPGGYVTAADVPERSSEAPRSEDLSARMRLAIAEATSRSKREIPHFYLAQTIPLQRSLAWLSKRNEQLGPDARILPIALFVRAVSRALRKVPELNGWYAENRLSERPDVQVTMAISLRGGGLVAPTLRDAEQLSLAQVSRAIEELVECARNGRLRSSQMETGTVGITNLGERGVELVLPVIMPPQVAMIGFGAVQMTPWVIDDSVVACPTVVATLAADHRACNGHRAGLFLRTVAQMLQEVPDE